MAALNRIAGADILDSLGIRKASERGVYRVTSAGFRTAGAVGRTFKRAGRATRGNRVPGRHPAAVRPHPGRTSR